MLNRKWFWGGMLLAAGLHLAFWGGYSVANIEESKPMLIENFAIIEGSIALAILAIPSICIFLFLLFTVAIEPDIIRHNGWHSGGGYRGAKVSPEVLAAFKKNPPTGGSSVMPPRW